MTFFPHILGRFPFFVLAALVNVAAILTMLLWTPVNGDNKPVFFTLAAMWGISDAVWQTQINGNYYEFYDRVNLCFTYFKRRFLGIIPLSTLVSLTKCYKIFVDIYTNNRLWWLINISQQTQIILPLNGTRLYTRHHQSHTGGKWHWCSLDSFGQRFQRRDGLMDGWTDRQLDGWTDGRTDGQTDKVT